MGTFVVVIAKAVLRGSCGTDVGVSTWSPLTSLSMAVCGRGVASGAQ